MGIGEQRSVSSYGSSVTDFNPILIEGCNDPVLKWKFMFFTGSEYYKKSVRRKSMLALPAVA